MYPEVTGSERGKKNDVCRIQQSFRPDHCLDAVRIQIAVENSSRNSIKELRNKDFFINAYDCNIDRNRYKRYICFMFYIRGSTYYSYLVA